MKHIHPLRRGLIYSLPLWGAFLAAWWLTAHGGGWIVAIALCVLLGIGCLMVPELIQAADAHLYGPEEDRQ